VKTSKVMILEMPVQVTAEQARISVRKTGPTYSVQIFEFLGS
jgi:ribosomal protein L18